MWRMSLISTSISQCAVAAQTLRNEIDSSAGWALDQGGLGWTQSTRPCVRWRRFNACWWGCHDLDVREAHFIATWTWPVADDDQYTSVSLECPLLPFFALHALAKVRLRLWGVYRDRFRKASAAINVEVWRFYRKYSLQHQQGSFTNWCCRLMLPGRPWVKFLFLVSCPTRKQS